MGFDILHIINSLVLVSISVVSFLLFRLCYKNKIGRCCIERVFGIHSIVYLAFSLMTFLWGIGYAKTTTTEFLVIGSFFKSVSAILFLFIVYHIVKNKNIFYFLSLFVLTSFSLLINPDFFIKFFPILHYLLLIMVSFDLFIVPQKTIKQISLLLISLSIISLGFLGINLFLCSSCSLPWFVPNLLYLLIFLMLLKNIGRSIVPIEETIKKTSKTISTLLFIKFIIFILSFTSFIFLSTVSVHEIGHSLASRYYGCEETQAIIYEPGSSAHTETKCKGYFNENIITLSGILFPLFLALLFIFTGNKFISLSSYMIFGFALLISAQDLRDLGTSESITIIIIFASVILLFYSIIRISISYVQQKGSLFENDESNKSFDLFDKKIFWIDKETYVKDLYDLADAIHNMTELKFNNLIQKRKNELVEWLNHINEEEIGNSMLKIENKKEIQKTIDKKILYEEQ